MPTLRELWQAGLARLPVPAHGENVFDRDWDMLLILDACRPDDLQRVSHEFEFLPDTVDTIYSRGSQSLEWMQATFEDSVADEMARTTYVTANVYSREFGEQLVDADAFASVDEVWRDHWDSDLGTVPAKAVTDAAIEAHGSSDRLLVHYLQPHAPYRSLDELDCPGLADDGTVKPHQTVWDLLESGEISRERVREAYREQLRWVLGEVEVLLESVDSPKVAITADHGELFGEYGLTSHPPVPVPKLRRVPWVETTAERLRDHEPRTTNSETTASVEERLTALGYKNGGVSS